MDRDCSGDHKRDTETALASFSGKERRRSSTRLMRRMVVEAAALGLQQRQLADYQCTVSSLTRRLDDVNALLREARQQLRDSAVVVENLRSQLRAERRQNVELKRTIESLINSQQQSSIRLAFYEEEQDYNEKLSSEAREKNQLLQTQLDNIHDELTKYKSLLVTSELEASQELAKHLDELNECRAREMQLLQTFRDEIPLRRKLGDCEQLTKLLARTEEYVAIKLELNQARQQLRSQAARAALLDVYTDELKSTLKEIAQLSQHHHCHHHHHQQQQQQLLTSTASAPDT